MCAAAEGAVGVLRAAEAVDLAARVVAELRDRGVRPEHRVLLCGANSTRYATVLLALTGLGVSIVPVDHRQPAGEVDRLAELTGADHVLTDGDVDALVAAAARRPRGGELSAAAWHDRSDALIAWTSGSTGRPKGVVRSGASVLDNTRRTLERMAYRADDVLLPLLPFSHQYGLSLVLLWWRAGCSLVVAPRTRLDQALDLAREHRATVVDATPMSYHTVLNLLRRDPGLLDGLPVRLWCVGGCPLDPALAERFRREVGAPLLDGYGSTETGNVALATPRDPVGCGRPLPGVRVAVLDEGGAPLPSGVTGELVVTSPDTTGGHLDDEGRFHPRPAGPYRTGDVGFLDAAGAVHVLGRRAAVHRMGHTLYPEALAHKASACGAPVQVVPLEDDRTGSRLVFVVADPERRDGRHWRARIEALLPVYEHPNRVVVVDEFPSTTTGKPDVDRLAALAREAVPRARQVGTRSVPFPERASRLRAVADFLRTDRGKVLEVLGEVTPHKAAQAELAGALRTLAGAVEEVRTHRPRPVERLAAFMPSNLLCYSYVLYLLVPALYTGRLVFRPSSKVADAARRLHDLLAPVHGLPIECSDLSQRRFLESAAHDADVVVFTGAYGNVERIRPELRPEQLLLFFGQGVNPFVVVDGADLGAAALDAMRVRLLNTGQDCFGPDVFLVPGADAERFVELLVKGLGELRYGDYADQDADYGPLYYDSAVEAAVDYLHRHRAHIVHGGRIDLRERHLQPTVLVRSCDERVPVEEVFSPIFNIAVYRDREQLWSFLREPYVNDRAMAAMVYGDDPGTVDLLARRHQVCVNRTLLDVEDGNQPFGGRGVVANYAAVRGRRVAEPLLISKAIADHLGTAPEGT
ncbi:aldehyde dehydrogenase family protein [Saccharothrix xinjiangensis]|uniref:Aldehyde dehydrogenase family protein n=1 Tax=Saccharothrix xinjiangensis TaxID=204798 RepID=A0ABV9Y8R7_9PSEU